MIKSIDLVFVCLLTAKLSKSFFNPQITYWPKFYLFYIFIFNSPQNSSLIHLRITSAWYAMRASKIQVFLEFWEAVPSAIICSIFTLPIWNATLWYTKFLHG